MKMIVVHRSLIGVLVVLKEKEISTQSRKGAKAQGLKR
jgi:hypothetical protein